MAAHAKLSPSGASRWMNCPGSIVLQESYPDTSSIHADEGTAAHTLAAMCLESPGIDADDFLNESIAVGDRKFTVTKDMAKHVQSYVSYVRERAVGKVLYVEQRVPIGHLTDEEGATGTVDAAIIDTANKHIEVIDLKFGMGVVVEAEENAQGMMYALGAIEEWDLLCEFETVDITIYQPRIRDEPSAWSIGRTDIEVFANEVAAAADTVRAATTRRDPGSDQWADAYLKAGTAQCKFCRVPKTVCPATRADMLEAVGAERSASAEDFAAFVVEPASAETGDNWLSVSMGKVEALEVFCKSVRAEMERRLLSGKTDPNWKLVEGRAGPRKWNDASAAEAALKGFRLKVEDMYDHTLISPTSAEKVLKETPRRWEKVQAFISRSIGKPSVAPASDKRAAWSVTATASDFADLVTTA